MKQQNKPQFEYFELHGHQCIRYDSDNSGINGELIGKVQYHGLSSKGSLTDGKVYDCIGLSFSNIRIIDDSGEPFYYGNRPSFKDRTAKFSVVEDNSPKNLLSRFIDGTESRTPLETEIEKDHIVYVIEASWGDDRKGHAHKHKYTRKIFAKRTPEINAAERERIKDIARFIADEYREELSILGMRPEKIKEFITLHEGKIEREKENLAQATKNSDKRYIEKRIDKYQRIINHAHKTLAKRESESVE